MLSILLSDVFFAMLNFTLELQLHTMYFLFNVELRVRVSRPFYRYYTRTTNTFIDSKIDSL